MHFPDSGIMSKEANRKTVEYHPADSNSRKTALPKNKSCPNIREVMNQNIRLKENRTIPANTYHSSKYFTMKGKSDLQFSSKLSEEEDEYETVSSSMLEAIHSLRILPAKPLQESEYADKRCLRPSGTTSPTSENPSQPLQHSTEPTPPPRPLKMLPKQYQPLPPEPRISSQVFHKRNMLSQDPTFPISAKVTRHSSVKESNEAPGREQVKSLRKKPEVSFQAQQHPPEASPLSTWSSKNICSSGSTSSVDNLTVKKPPPPTPYAACKNKSKHLLAEQEMQSLTQPTEKDLNKCEWYIGEYDRHKAEKILLQKNVDETFLVRDCSKKSKAEPYVLVVYYGRRVYNIKVRFLEESQQYALGTGLRGESVSKIPSVVIVYSFYVGLHKFLIANISYKLSHITNLMFHYSFFYITVSFKYVSSFKELQHNNLKPNFAYHAQIQI
ncbi:cytokine-dependent hematopoietic cell linker isoform X2 [Corvus hawaiiensis]|uniref:cytokine-dependent hematopoietic cell linker isoform X2 n=1 Tax=Corvus hawaiiensis TaxID=134902 RepID=UPI002019D606|nr:cytokine-dependent hematopoietic cell linker isoform X2 [Corvus hawaiiensis]